MRNHSELVDVYVSLSDIENLDIRSEYRNLTTPEKIRLNKGLKLLLKEIKQEEEASHAAD